MMPSSRKSILAKLAAATTPVRTPQRQAAYAALARPYIQTGSRDHEACLALLIERLRDYDAVVKQCAADELPAAIAAVTETAACDSFVVPPGLPQAWLAQAKTWQYDTALGRDDINAAGGVVTAASCAIADSGTIALHHGPDEGRRILTLLPDWQLIILRSGQVVETLPEYFTRFPLAPPLVTWISGPSATADIEMTRIKGVHGPRFLNVILVREES